MLLGACWLVLRFRSRFSGRDLQDGILSWVLICGEVSPARNTNPMYAGGRETRAVGALGPEGARTSGIRASGVKHAERESRHSQPTRFFQDSYRHPDS